MPTVTYSAYEPLGQHLTDTYGYSQALVIHPVGLVKLSGQGGWLVPPTSATNQPEASADEPAFDLPSDTTQHIRAACDNVERALQSAGVKRGWSSVISVRSYHTDLDATFEGLSDELKARAPHKPVWTCVGVTRLALPAMQIEIEVEALLEDD